jgi:hypothetical protein
MISTGIEAAARRSPDPTGLISLAASATAPPPAWSPARSYAGGGRRPQRQGAYAIGLIAGLMRGAVHCSSTASTADPGERDIEGILAPGASNRPIVPRHARRPTGSDACGHTVAVLLPRGYSYRRLRSTLEFLANATTSNRSSSRVPDRRTASRRPPSTWPIAALPHTPPPHRGDGAQGAIVSRRHATPRDRASALRWPTHVGISEYLLAESEAILMEVPSDPESDGG